MAKRPRKGTGSASNADRNNGKAWKTKKTDAKGRPLTGRGKPTGRSDRGMKVDTPRPAFMTTTRSLLTRYPAV